MDRTQTPPTRHTITISTPRSADPASDALTSETALKGIVLSRRACARAAAARLTGVWIVDCSPRTHQHSHGSYTDPTYTPCYHHQHTEVMRYRKRCSETALRRVTLGRRSCARAAAARLIGAWVVQNAPRTYSHSHGSYTGPTYTPYYHRRHTEVMRYREGYAIDTCTGLVCCYFMMPQAGSLHAVVIRAEPTEACLTSAISMTVPPVGKTAATPR